MAGGGGNEPNLTPFIDLFSVLICFLLMSAAWIQLESVQVGVEKKNDNAMAAEPNPTPPPSDDKKKVKLTVKVFLGEVLAFEDEIESIKIPYSEDSLEDRMVPHLAHWKRKFPDRKDIIINSDSSATYGQLIKLYDILVAHDWTEVGINPY